MFSVKCLSLFFSSLSPSGCLHRTTLHMFVCFPASTHLTQFISGSFMIFLSVRKIGKNVPPRGNSPRNHCKCWASSLYRVISAHHLYTHSRVNMRCVFFPPLTEVKSPTSSCYYPDRSWHLVYICVRVCFFIHIYFSYIAIAWPNTEALEHRKQLWMQTGSYECFQRMSIRV